ncbi:hypothetical protein GCK32_012904 [Trichostrongylus colubriformis]|uniref:Uncharacterized protein n=1 Tax=Trichostrongylus colubriformis TaxID=6319 RepID=A0AAN8EU98_TRICO
MRWWWCLVTLLFPMVTTYENSDIYDMPIIQRPVRAFPYSVSLNEILGHNRRLYAISDDDLSSIIDQMNSYSLQRQRRDGHPYKRYACRFKFCRIFDA